MVPSVGSPYRPPDGVEVTVATREADQSTGDDARATECERYSQTICA